MIKQADDVDIDIKNIGSRNSQTMVAAKRRAMAFITGKSDLVMARMILRTAGILPESLMNLSYIVFYFVYCTLYILYIYYTSI